MVAKQDICQIPLPDPGSNLLELCLENATKATMFGQSNIHRDKEKRKATCSPNNIVGQIGQCCISGAIAGCHQPYIISRIQANDDRWAGDGGIDIPGTNVDIKCSDHQNRNRHPIEYHLWVRDKEFHEDHIYIQGLVNFREWVCYVLGWATSDTLVRYGVRKEDRLELGHKNLSPLMPIEEIPIQWAEWMPHGLDLDETWHRVACILLGGPEGLRRVLDSL